MQLLQPVLTLGLLVLARLGCSVLADGISLAVALSPDVVAGEPASSVVDILAGRSDATRVVMTCPFVDESGQKEMEANCESTSNIPTVSSQAAYYQARYIGSMPSRVEEREEKIILKAR